MPPSFWQQPGASGQPALDVLRKISPTCGYTEIEQLYDYFTSPSSSKDEIMAFVSQCRRDLKYGQTHPPSSSSKHTSGYSQFSRGSTISFDSRSSTTYEMLPDQLPLGSNTASQFHYDSSSPFPITAPSPHPLQLNHNSPRSGTTAAGGIGAENTIHVCIRCQKWYDTKGSLSRHRSEACESRGIYVCPSCPKRKPLQFPRWETLRNHLRDKHPEICGENCNWSDTAPCQTHLPKSAAKAALHEYPSKKAWGCPVCSSCFHTRGEWQEHETVHYQDLKVVKQRDSYIPVKGWGRGQLVSSLSMASMQLWRAMSRYNWNLCDWQKLDDKIFEALAFTLERQTLATDVRCHESYAYLNLEDALAAYAYRIGTTGNPLSPLSMQPHLPPATTVLGSSPSVISLDPGIPPSTQMHASSLQPSPFATSPETDEYRARETITNENQTVLLGSIGHSVPSLERFHRHYSGPNSEQNTQLNQGEPVLRSSFPVTTRSKAKGHIRDSVIVAKGRSMASRTKEVAVDESVAVSLPATSIYSPPGTEQSHLGQSPSFISIPFTDISQDLPGCPGSVNDNRANANVSPPRQADNSAEHTGYKRMSYEMTEITFVESYSPSTPGGLEGDVFTSCEFNEIPGYDEHVTQLPGVVVYKEH
ncbi:hypothetical protein LTR84_003075 [Exophiala bonariae]|uniref:C2H2-type domain-containing protein n=1 Tax=Exophiala bonariae TaxID=1690606 RepID=A0AAV9N7N1_9EURO|nr:hypothetical protein LTR84_003075 [Exophiala bonariae]